MKEYGFLKTIVTAVYPVMIIDVFILVLNSFAFYYSINLDSYLNGRLLDTVIICIAAVLLIRKLKTVKSVAIGITLLTLLWEPLIAVIANILLQSYGLLHNVGSFSNFLIGVLIASFLVLPLNLIIGFFY